jgi:hypothetical protein
MGGWVGWEKGVGVSVGGGETMKEVR